MTTEKNIQATKKEQHTPKAGKQEEVMTKTEEQQKAPLYNDSLLLNFENKEVVGRFLTHYKFSLVLNTKDSRYHEVAPNVVNKLKEISKDVTVIHEQNTGKIHVNIGADTDKIVEKLLAFVYNYQYNPQALAKMNELLKMFEGTKEFTAETPSPLLPVTLPINEIIVPNNPAKEVFKSPSVAANASTTTNNSKPITEPAEVKTATQAVAANNSNSMEIITPTTATSVQNKSSAREVKINTNGVIFNPNEQGIIACFIEGKEVLKVENAHLQFIEKIARQDYVTRIGREAGDDLSPYQEAAVSFIGNDIAINKFIKKLEKCCAALPSNQSSKVQNKSNASEVKINTNGVIFNPNELAMVRFFASRNLFKIENNQIQFSQKVDREKYVDLIMEAMRTNEYQKAAVSFIGTGNLITNFTNKLEKCWAESNASEVELSFYTNGVDFDPNETAILKFFIAGGVLSIAENNHLQFIEKIDRQDYVTRIGREAGDDLSPYQEAAVSFIGNDIAINKFIEKLQECCAALPSNQSSKVQNKSQIQQSFTENEQKLLNFLKTEHLIANDDQGKHKLIRYLGALSLSLLNNIIIVNNDEYKSLMKYFAEHNNELKNFLGKVSSNNLPAYNIFENFVNSFGNDTQKFTEKEEELLVALTAGSFVTQDNKRFEIAAFGNDDVKAFSELVPIVEEYKAIIQHFAEDIDKITKFLEKIWGNINDIHKSKQQLKNTILNIANTLNNPQQGSFTYDNESAYKNMLASSEVHNANINNNNFQQHKQ